MDGFAIKMGRKYLTPMLSKHHVSNEYKERITIKVNEV